MKIKRNQKGFTLIEVVLVLAIGGLIFLLAFLAFQQVSKNRRDTQRRTDAARIVSEVQNAAGDSSTGARPATYVGSGADICSSTATDAFIVFSRTYLCANNGTEFRVPNANTNYQVINVLTAFTDANQVKYASGNQCNDSTPGALTANAQSVAVLIKLESGVVCRDSR